MRLGKLVQGPGPNWAAYAGVGAGLVVSVWANIEHAVREAPGQGGAVILAGFVPLSLFLSLEVLMRQRKWKDAKALLWMARAGTAVVASAAAAISYQHLYGLAMDYAESRLTALIIPLAIDALMAVCAASLLASTADRRPVARRKRQEPQGEPVAPRAVTARAPRATVGDDVVSLLEERRARGLSRPEATAEVARVTGRSVRTVQRHAASVWGVAA